MLLTSVAALLQPKPIRRHECLAAPCARPEAMVGIGLKVISVTVFVGMQTSLKSLGTDIPAGQLVFFRSFFALLPVLAYLCWLGTLRTAFHTRDIGGHFVRGAVGVTSMGLGFYAIGRLPYPEWITISYASPLLTVVFAAIILRERVGRFRWTAVLVGLCGIVVVIAPISRSTSAHSRRRNGWA